MSTYHHAGTLGPQPVGPWYRRRLFVSYVQIVIL